MRSTPDLDLLLEAAADTLRQAIIPALDGAPAYQARMVANILGIAIREIAEERPTTTPSLPVWASCWAQPRAICATSTGNWPRASATATCR